MVYSGYDYGCIERLIIGVMRGKKAEEKVKRVKDSIYFNSPDMFPLQDMFFWEQFLKNWRKYFMLDPDTDIFKYYDYDLVCVSPNIDPLIDNVVEIEKTQNHVVYRGGFGSTLRLDFGQPVPQFIDYAVKDIKQLNCFEFEDPLSDKRFEQNFAVVDQYEPVDAFCQQLEFYGDDFCLFGNVCEARETVWRVLGMENEFRALIDFPDSIRSFSERAAEFNIQLGKKQLENDYIDGLIIYGDIAYKNGLLMSPAVWREIYLPPLKKMVEALKV